MQGYLKAMRDQRKPRVLGYSFPKNNPTTQA